MACVSSSGGIICFTGIGSGGFVSRAVGDVAAAAVLLSLLVARTHFRSSRYADVNAMLEGLGFAIDPEVAPFIPFDFVVADGAGLLGGFEDALAARFFPRGATPEALAMRDFLYAPLGAATAARWLLTAWLFHEPLRRRERWAYRAVAWSLGLGFLLGVPLPSGIRLLEQSNPGLIPWAWAVNGCASVISSILAVLGAVSAGFSLVLVAGAVAYLIAWAAAAPLSRLAKRVTP